jgi:hypothetical protein
MSKADSRSRFKNTEYPDLPKGWRWVGGNLSDVSYTDWFETKYKMGGRMAGVGNRLGGYDGQVYYDEGGNGKHTVVFYPVISPTEDEFLSPYPDVVEKYDTMQEAVDAVPELIDDLPELVE